MTANPITNVDQANTTAEIDSAIAGTGQLAEIGSGELILESAANSSSGGVNFQTDG